MKHFFPLLVIAALLTWGSAAHSQEGGAPVGWLKSSADTPLRGSWSLYAEVETRQGNAWLNGQHLGRLGLRLHPAPFLTLTTGYVLAANDGTGAYGLTGPEHRLYQEALLVDATGPVRASHRLRVEERWLRPMPEQAFRFAPRLRYQLRLVLPLHTGGKLPVGALYLVAADELFATLGPHQGRSFVEENRASGGLGYRLSRRTAVELSYLHQTQADDSAGRALARNALQVHVTVATPTYRSLVSR